MESLLLNPLVWLIIIILIASQHNTKQTKQEEILKEIRDKGDD